MTTIPPPGAPEGPALLLTRPQAGSEAFLKELGGWIGRTVISPLTEIVAVETPCPKVAAAALIFTSKNAVARYSGPMDLPAFCIGTATTRAAERRGFEARCIAPDAGGLIATLPALEPPEPLWHVRGVHVAQPIATHLGAAGLRCFDWVVYDQVARGLTAEARLLLSRPGAVVLPVFSPRSADILGEALREEAPVADCIFPVISSAVASRLVHHLHAARIHLAESPDASGMVQAVHASARHVRALEGKPPLP